MFFPLDITLEEEAEEEEEEAAAAAEWSPGLLSEPERQPKFLLEVGFTGTGFPFPLRPLWMLSEELDVVEDVEDEDEEEDDSSSAAACCISCMFFMFF